MKKAIKFSFATAAVVATLGAAVAPTLVSAWGDNSGLPGMRPSYTMKQIDEGVLGDKITFNSISDNTSLGAGENGNEKGFVAAREYNDANTESPFRTDSLKVEDGKEYVIRMYVHNNSPRGRQAIARDVRAFFNIPNIPSKTMKVTGYITAPNATPTEYWDHVNLTSDTAFHLQYIEGSATLVNNVLDKNDKATGQIKRTTLSDNIVKDTNGVLIGSESLNGEIPGCYPFSQLVTIRVKAVYDYDYSVNTTVRLANDADKTWKKEVDAKIGDKVEFQIEYKNTSKIKHEDVVIRDILPSNLKFVGGTTLYNTNHPKGMTMDNPEHVVGTGLFIGSYNAGANAFVRFTAEVVNDNFTCGDFVLHNWGRASVAGRLVQDSAAVKVALASCPDPETPPTPVDPEKPTEPTTPTNPTTPGTPSELPSTGPVAVAGSVIGIGSIVTAAGYYIASRRALR